jgi:hypothetical protein
VPKAFFCHASEDKPVVEAVYNRVLATEPDLEAWLDKYEIRAGESLIERIAAGMDESDKFIVFLSPRSINKPWVKRELRRALMREINEVDPDYIVPVLVDEIAAMPPFLEDKKYIALYRMTEEEWLAELVAAIQGTRPGVPAQNTDNIQVRLSVTPDEPHVARVIFEARFWTTRASFIVHTNQDIVATQIEWPANPWGGAMMDVIRSEDARFYAFRCSQPEVRPGNPLAFVLTFAPGTDASKAIARVGEWRPPPL